MNKKSFTLMEILVVLIIIGIFATLGMPALMNVVEESQARVCEENLKALKAALDIYAMENDKMPSTLSNLPQEYIQKAYAKVISQRDKSSAWKIKLAQIFSDCKHHRLAYAASDELNLKRDLAKDNLKLATCPMNKGSSISYGLNSGLANMTNKEYRDLRVNNPNYLLIGDCTGPTFSGAGQIYTSRHKRNNVKFGLVITRGGTVCVVTGGSRLCPGETGYNNLHPWK